MLECDIPHKKTKRNKKQSTGFSLNLVDIYPKTDRQIIVFDNFEKNNFFLHGSPGTGKTFISIFLALAYLEYYKNGVTIIRSTVPSRDIGFLPGSEKEKIKVYESPYVAICNELYKRGDAYDILKAKG
jgi:predicted ribonuclease YlaK